MLLILELTLLEDKDFFFRVKILSNFTFFPKLKNFAKLKIIKIKQL